VFNWKMGRRERLRSGEHRARRDREQQGDDDRSGDARSRRRASQFDAGALDEERLHQFLPSPRGGEGGRHFDEGPGYLDLYPGRRSRDGRRQGGEEVIDFFVARRHHLDRLGRH